MLAEPSRLRHALEPTELAPDLDAPVVPVLLDDDQPENATALTCYTTPVSDGQVTTSAAIQAGRGASDHLERASQGDLLSPPDFRIPRALDEQLCRRSVGEAGISIGSDPNQAEPLVALALVLGGGVREIDLRGIVWGGENDAHPHAIDPVIPVLYKHIKRPVNAVRPTEELAEWLKPSLEVLAWPLPNSVHGLLLRLAKGAPRPGDSVLPLLAGSINAPYRLQDVIGQVMPELQLGALAPRLALASELARALGSEMAQLSLADTFSLSAIPAYYSAMSEAELVEFLAKAQSRRFGEHVNPRVKRAGYIGSRLVLTDPAARLWSARVRESLRTEANKSAGPLDQWRMHRDHLAAVLCSATGHRPENALGNIFLSDVIPEYGLIILQDKQVDALRASRIAATGRLWLAELRRYLDRLIKVSIELAGEPAGELAASILRCEAPLMTVPTPAGGVSPMTAAVLRACMPPELRSVDNFFRHRLNQCLQVRRVDPELRHAQLGWVVSPAHFTADLSPRAPIDLGRELGPVIDDLLVADGWYPLSTRKTRWTWDGVPMPDPVDWDAGFASHKRQHEEEIKRIRLQLRERWKQYESPVMIRLGAAIQELSPLLRLDLEKRALVPVNELMKAQIEMGADHHALICDRVRQGDQDPSSALEAVVARILLYRLARRARETGLIKGPIPSRPYLTTTSDPSPFLPRLGIAVRQAEAIRRDLVERAGQNKVRDLGPLTVWSILAFSMYRRLPWAMAATTAARGGMRAAARAQVIRIPSIVEGVEVPMVFGALPATLLARRKQHAPTARSPTTEALEGWALSHLSRSVRWADTGAAIKHLESALAAAAHIELSGIERLLLRSQSRTAAESSIRCIARDDGWPVRTANAVAQQGGSGDSRRQPTLVEAGASVEQSAGHQVVRRSAYASYVGLLNKRKFGQTCASKSPKGKNKASDGKHGWRDALRKALIKLREEVSSDPSLATLIDYSLDHLRYGSEAGNKLTQNSLQREITQIGWPLLALLADRNFPSLTAEELRKLYQDVLFSKSDESRAYAFEELQRLHRYLVRMHACPQVDMAALAAIAGSRKQSVDPGLLTPAELELTYQMLVLDYEQEKVRADASPDFLRLAVLRRILYLILEASGIRPGSAYGLTLADLHFFGERGDFVHVRVSGEFGEAKTRTSIGFVPLESVLWNSNREWVLAWLQEQRASIPDGNWTGLPLFSMKLGQRVRVHDHHITDRINQLLKWASGSHKAHCYWLRKVRISNRFHALQQRQDVYASDVHGMMAISGQALIQTPIASYINDPASLLFADLRASAKTPRAALLAGSGLSSGPLDMAWSRSSGDGDGATRISILLDRLCVMPMAPDEQFLTDPPALRRFKPFLPVHVDAYARAMHRCKNRVEAILEAGITDQQAIRLDEGAHALLLRRGCAPWKLREQLSMSSTMEVPRLFAGVD